ncbi:MAG: hypothetical protein AAGA90_07815 [Actinomycetota bacterium]
MTYRPASEDHAQILAAIAAYPMTSDDVEIMIPFLERYRASKVMFELRGDGLIERTGEQRHSRALNLLDVHRATDVGASVAEPWRGPPPAEELYRAHERGSAPVTNGSGFVWPCPTCKRAWNTSAGLLLHFNRYCDRIHVLPREDSTS